MHGKVVEVKEVSLGRRVCMGKWQHREEGQCAGDSIGVRNFVEYLSIYDVCVSGYLYSVIIFEFTGTQYLGVLVFKYLLSGTTVFTLIFEYLGNVFVFLE